MKNSKKHIFCIAIIVAFVILTACSTTNNTEEIKKVQSDTALEVVADETLAFSDGDFESYMKYITNIPDFKPYYKIVFDFENLPNNIPSVPIENVNIMYREMEDTFDYILLSEQPLFYRGDYNQGLYKGNTSFVDGYEQYKNADDSINTSTPINFIEVDWEGNEFTATSLKTVMLGESIFRRFDDNIEEGRNLQKSDFTLKSSDQPISAVLGNEYKELYKIGDTFSLELVSKVMNFQVVGFYKPDVSFFMDVGAKHQVSFDYTIVIPHLMFDYKPLGEEAVFQQAYLAAEKMSGYIGITEPIEKINDDTYVKYTDILKTMAEKNGVLSLYKVPYKPVGFIW